MKIIKAYDRINVIFKVQRGVIMKTKTVQKFMICCITFALFSQASATEEAITKQSKELTKEEKIILKEIEMTSYKQDDLVAEKLANGTVMIDLKGRFQMMSKAQKEGDSIHYHCGNATHKHTTDATKTKVEIE